MTRLNKQHQRWRRRRRRRRTAAAAAGAAAAVAIGASATFLFDNNQTALKRVRRLGLENTTHASPFPYRRIYNIWAGQGLSLALFPQYYVGHAGATNRRIVNLDMTDLQDASRRDSTPTPSEDDLLVINALAADNDDFVSNLWSSYSRFVDLPGTKLYYTPEGLDTQGFPRDRMTEGRVEMIPNQIDLPRTKVPELQYPTSPIPSEDGNSHQGAVASQYEELSKPGMRYNWLPPGDRTYVLGPHEDTESSVRAYMVQLTSWWNSDPMETNRWMWDAKRRPDNRPFQQDKHFAVFLASHCTPMRDEAVKRIAALDLGEVHVTQTWLAHCAGEEPNPNLKVAPGLAAKKAFRRNHLLYSKYQFVLALENSYREGYVTEKIVHAFHSGAVPIYYGGLDVHGIYNPDAFIFFDVENPDPALQTIQRLVENEEEYRRIQTAPILKDGLDTIAKYFSITDEVGEGFLKKKILKMLGVEASLSPLSSKSR